MGMGHCSRPCILEVITAANSDVGKAPWEVEDQDAAVVSGIDRMSCVMPWEVVDQEPGHTGQWYETGRNSGDNKKH